MSHHRKVTMRRIALLFPLLLILALGAAACGSDDDEGSSGAAAADEPLRVGVSPVPHAEILNFVKDELADKAGLKLEVKEFSDYVLPNTALNDGQLDANYFQTPAYLKDQAKARDLDLVSIVGVHIEPLGIYSKKHKDLAAVPKGAKVAIPNDATNENRALQLLAANDLVTLKDGATDNATVRDIEDNPKDLDFSEVDAAQTARSLDDVDLAVINGNYALEADIKPATDGLALEQAEGNPNANLLVTLGKDKDDPRVKKLAELLTSPEVKEFIEDKYQGAVIPAF
jgi:D-methionine transport system substrate-binding protein